MAFLKQSYKNKHSIIPRGPSREAQSWFSRCNKDKTRLQDPNMGDGFANTVIIKGVRHEGIWRSGCL